MEQCKGCYWSWEVLKDVGPGYCYMFKEPLDGCKKHLPDLPVKVANILLPLIIMSEIIGSIKTE